MQKLFVKPSRPSMRFVNHKTVDQQDIHAAHRIREELVQQRTAKANQIRGLVGEYGLVAPIGPHQLRNAIPLWLEEGSNGLTFIFRQLLSGLFDDFTQLDKRVAEMNQHIEQAVQKDPVATRLMSLPGVGPLTASALVGALGQGESFKRGRDFAASLGLTPRQHSTGGKDRLLGSSKRGDGYLRKLLVHGARAVLRHTKDKQDNASQWIQRLMARKHANVVVVALANKTARIAWALVHKNQSYDSHLAAH